MGRNTLVAICVERFGGHGGGAVGISEGGRKDIFRWT